MNYDIYDKYKVNNNVYSIIAGYNGCGYLLQIKKDGRIIYDTIIHRKHELIKAIRYLKNAYPELDSIGAFNWEIGR